MTYVRILVGLAITGGCVVALLSQIDLRLTWSALARAHVGWLVLVVPLLLAMMLTKAYRWGLLYYPTRGLHLGNLTSALFIGYMVSALIPMRLGELVRAYLIGKREPVTFPQSVGTILVEKVLDVVTLLGFLAVLGLLVPLPQLAVSGPVLAAAGLGGLGTLFGLAWLPRGRVLGVLEPLQRYLPGLRRWDVARLLGPFLDALAILRYGRLLPSLAWWSVLNWSLAGLVNYVMLLALDVPASLPAAAFLLIVSNLGLVVPAAPGYVGVYHYLVVLALSAFDVEASHAMGYALVLHAAVYGLFIVGGLFYVWRGGHRLADLSPVQGSARPVAATEVEGALSPAAASTARDRSIPK